MPLDDSDRGRWLTTRRDERSRRSSPVAVPIHSAPSPVLAHELDGVAGQRRRVAWTVAKDDGSLRERIDAVQATARAEPQRPRRVLAHAGDIHRAGLLSLGGDAMRGEDLAARVETVEKAIAADPERVRAIPQERIDPDAAEAVLLPRIVSEHPQLMAIVSVKAALGPEPHEALVVLDDLLHARLRQSLGSHPPELKVVSIDERHRQGDPLRVEYCARRTRLAVLTCLRERSGSAQHGGDCSAPQHPGANYRAIGVAVAATGHESGQTSRSEGTRWSARPWG